MDLKLLREATRPEHEATEASVPLLRPDLTRADYVAVLHRFHRVVCAWDTVAAAEAPAAYAELVRQRSRCASLQADLNFFGEMKLHLPPEELLHEIRELIGDHGQAPHDERSSRFLGAMYVLEGSTLGGQYIAHQVEAGLKLQPGEGDHFFRGYGKDTMPKWREFQQALLALPDAQSGPVIAAAKQMFGLFQHWLTRDVTVSDAAVLAPGEMPHGFGAEAA